MADDRPARLVKLCRYSSSYELTQAHADAVLRALQDPRTDWADEQYEWVEDLFISGGQGRERIIPAAKFVLRNLHRLTLGDTTFVGLLDFRILRFVYQFGLVDEFRALLEFTAARRLQFRFSHWNEHLPACMPVEMLRLALGCPHVTGYDGRGGALHWCAEQGHAAELRAILATPKGSPNKHEPLCTAVKRGHVDCVEALLQDGRTSATDRRNALAVAAARDDVGVLALLDAHGVRGAAAALMAARWNRRRDFFAWPRGASVYGCSAPDRHVSDILGVLKADDRFGVWWGRRAALRTHQWRMMNVVAGAVARFL